MDIPNKNSAPLQVCATCRIILDCQVLKPLKVAQRGFRRKSTTLNFPQGELGLLSEKRYRYFSSFWKCLALLLL